MEAFFFCDASYLSSSQHQEATFIVPPTVELIQRCLLYTLGAEVQVLRWQLLKINQIFLPDFSELLASFSAYYVKIGFHFAVTSVATVNAQCISSPNQKPFCTIWKMRIAKLISVRKKYIINRLI